MNKSIIKYFLFTIFSFMFIASNALADDNCTYKDQQALMKEAQNIKTSYEFIKDDPLNYHFIIYITNITDNLRLEITNDYLDKEELNVTANDLVDGVYTIETRIASRKVTYNIDIYSNGEKCNNQKLMPKKVVTPRYNTYSTSYICEQAPEFKYCGEFYDTSKLSYKSFLEQGSKYLQEKLGQDASSTNKPLYKKIVKILKDYKLYIMVSIIIILIALGTIFSINKYKRNKRGI